MRRMIAAGGAGALLAGLCVWSGAAAEAVRAAGERCLCGLVPALFLYTMLAAACTKSGLIASLSRTVRGRLAVVLVVSQLAGYPVGAQMLTEMAAAGDISREEKRRSLGICIGCGPGFLLGTVCRGMSWQAVTLMILSVSLPNAVMMLAAWHCLPRQRLLRTTPHLDARTLTGSVDAAAAAMVKITAMIVAFAGVGALLEESGLVAAVCAVLPVDTEQGTACLRAIWEVSNVSGYLEDGGGLPGAAALLAFGGVCVHLQTASIAGEMPWLRFWGCRILAAAGAWGICRAGMGFLPTVPAFSASMPSVSVTGDPMPSVCLMLMAVILLLDRRMGQTAQKSPCTQRASVLKKK